MNLARPPQIQTARLRPRPVACVCLILLFPGVFCGCSHLRPSSGKDKAEITTLQTRNQKVGATLPVLQSEVMRFADDYATTIAQATDDFASASTNQQSRSLALKWKLEQAGAAYIDAAGHNPILNALDLVVLTTLSRMVIESIATNAALDSSLLNLLEAHRRFETNAWGVVAGVLRPEQKTELAGIMRDWRAQNPHQRYVGGVRFREFAAGGKVSETTKTKPTSVFNLLFIDPMAGLDPTARAIEETRQTAERITYYAQRAPVLLSWQAQLLTYQLTEQPALRQLLENADRLSKAAEVFARTADKLPDLITEQRQAAIEEFFDGIANERTNLVASLASEEEKVRALLVDTRETLNAGNQMAGSVDGAIKSLHSFVRFVSPGLASNAVPSVVSSNQPPFNVLDYGTAAAQIGVMAADVNRLLTSVNQNMPQATRLGQQARTEAQALVDHIFWRSLLLLLVLLVGSLAAAFGYRLLSRKLTHRFLNARSLEPRDRHPRSMPTKGGINL